jgi:hypothetical protein
VGRVMKGIRPVPGRRQAQAGLAPSERVQGKPKSGTLSGR